MHSIFSETGILLVTRTVYSQRLASHWSHAQYILRDWHPIGHTLSIFSVTVIPLITRTVYSQRLASYWSHAQYILSDCHPIGHTHSIFSETVILLVTRTVYSQRLASYWSHAQYILRDWHPIGHTHSIFSVTSILLVTRTCGRRWRGTAGRAVYSQRLASHWSHAQYVLRDWHPIGHTHMRASVERNSGTCSMARVR
jgi:hypothetical protein